MGQFSPEDGSKDEEQKAFPFSYSDVVQMRRTVLENCRASVCLLRGRELVESGSVHSVNLGAVCVLSWYEALCSSVWDECGALLLQTREGKGASLGEDEDRDGVCGSARQFGL